MSASRNTAAAPPGVSFEVDRFAWADGRLEVSGRWYGIRGRRFLRPTLDVEVDGAPRRMLAVLEHKPWAAGDGEQWVAAFDWNGDPAPVAVAELAVAPELAVVLPPPSGGPTKKARSAKAAGERLEAAPPRAQALEAELTEARAEIARLRDRLAAEQKAWLERVAHVEALRDESAAAKRAAEAERDEAAAARNEATAARDEATAARDEATAGRDDLLSARDAAIGERDAAVAARDAAVAARNAAVAARDAAAEARDAALADTAKATEERDKAVLEKAAVEHELIAATRARDKARQERNEWLTRARDAAARQGTAGREPPPARREARPAEPEPPPARREARPAEPDAPPAPAAEAATTPLPRRPAPAGRPRKAQIPPGGILLPPTGPGSHMRRSILPGWAPRVLAPILLVVLVVVIALLIGWAF